MDTQTLERLIEKRDETVRDLGRFMPTTLASVLDGQAVTLFDGIVMRKIEDEYKHRDRDADGWYYSDVTEKTLIAAVKDNDIEQYFKFDVYYDSWDNGEPDEWKIREIEEVQKVPVEKYEWKVVY